MLRLGDYWGRKYEYLRFYLPFAAKTGLKYVHWRHCLEAIRERQYEVDGFLPKKGEIVVDVGAQYADYSVIWSKLYGASVVAYEPIRASFDEATANIQLNHADVRIYCAAVGDGSYIKANIGKDRMLRKDHVGESYPTLALDEQGSDIPSLIKVDVEGFEMEVLRGAEATLRRYRPRMIVETHSTDLRLAVCHYMSGIGYENVIIGRTTQGAGWMNEVTNLFFS